MNADGKLSRAGKWKRRRSHISDMGWPQKSSLRKSLSKDTKYMREWNHPEKVVLEEKRPFQRKAQALKTLRRSMPGVFKKQQKVTLIEKESRYNQRYPRRINLLALQVIEATWLLLWTSLELTRFWAAGQHNARSVLKVPSIFLVKINQKGAIQSKKANWEAPP